MKGAKYSMWVLGLLALFVLPLVAQAGAVGKFTHIEGRADITSPGQPARPAILGDEISVGDIVRTKSKSKAEITFVDGNILRLAESTRVKISEYMVEEEKSSRVLNLFRGKVRNIVRTVGEKFGRDRPHRHEVHTPIAVCGVRGTDHTDTHGPAGSQFVFHDGEGQVWSQGQPDKPVPVKAGVGVWVNVPDQIPITGPLAPDQQQKEKDATEPQKEAPTEEKAAPDEGPTPPPEEGARATPPGTMSSYGIDPILQKTFPETVANITADGQGNGEDGKFIILLAAISYNEENNAWDANMNGTYQGKPFDNWYLQLSDEISDPDVRRWVEVNGTKWSDDTIAATVAGAWVEWKEAITGVAGGRLSGTFDPLETTWQAAANGAMIETTHFLQYASTSAGKSKLAQLDIPYVQIGKADLTGSKNFGNDGTMSVTMHDVSFFAYSTGAAPRIWATGNVTGDYTGSPQVGWVVNNLKGENYQNAHNLHADFTLQRWDTGAHKWGAIIDKGHGQVGGHNIQFNGGAAGTITSSQNEIQSVSPGTVGTFNGTGAGVARPE